jgi:hypothetical protein
VITWTAGPTTYQLTSRFVDEVHLFTLKANGKYVIRDATWAEIWPVMGERRPPGAGSNWAWATLWSVVPEV